MTEATKLIIEVTAGVFPGEPEEEFTRRWSLTSEEANEPYTMMDAVGAALNYAAVLANPSKVNWVRHEWIWL